MALDPAELPDDIVALKAMLVAADKHARGLDAEIETLNLTIAKLQHERFGPSSERARLLDQLELQLGELVERAAQAETASEIAAAQSQTNQQHKPPRRKPARRPLPDHLPRERRVEPSPTACPCCGGRLRKLGEDVTETLERSTRFRSVSTCSSTAIAALHQPSGGITGSAPAEAVRARSRSKSKPLSGARRN
jgi:hypothetical protein